MCYLPTLQCMLTHTKMTVNPHPRLQKNLLVCSLRGPRGPQKLSRVVKKICKPRDHCSMFYFKEGLNNLY